MKPTNVCTKIIEYAFYSLFLLVPLIFSGSTSELFELNKMWLTFGLTTIVVTAWLTIMVIEKRFFLQRTPLDIPIVLFLFSQLIATLFSMDQHVSWWGYYSRFNGGMASIICYVLLYYAFVSNLQLKHVMRTLKISLIAGFLTALWGFPAHFGYDPTCLMFRGTLDTSCWTEAFKPTVRTFSTLGQPAWFAAYLTLLIPIAASFAFLNQKTHEGHKSAMPAWRIWVEKIFHNWTWVAGMYFALTLFMYVNLLFANTRAAFIAFWVANAAFWALIFLKKYLHKKQFIRNFALFNLGFLLITFIVGTPMAQLNKFTLPQLTAKESIAPPPAETLSGAPPVPGGNITDSGDIRLNVWNGSIEAWKVNPVFGTGVETFAFAYYKYKPAAHNLTSEWDYLYNKAHNEYLNYLTTTGIFGLGSYLAIIGLTLFFVFKHFFSNVLKRVHNHNAALSHESTEARREQVHKELLVIGLISAFISILITNFFGFSVVIINLYFFLIPLFIFYLTDVFKKYPYRTFPAHVTDQAAHENAQSVSPMRWTAVTVLLVLAGWLSIDLLLYRQADIAYALGSNYNKIGNYQEAYPQLTNAVASRPNEPVYKDELSINLAAISAGLYAQNQATTAAQLSDNAITLSNELVQNHPNNVVYWKNRVRLFYTLSATDTANQGVYLGEALRAINKAHELAPNDAKVMYNQGILYGQTGDLNKGISILEETIKIKPNYTDAYIALGLFYREQSVDKEGKVINPERNQKAIDTYQFILDNLSPDNKEVKASLTQWENS